ncbi:metal-dependent phosphohydrolase [Nocardia sp. NPDC052566]|uniref:metal-dependent phosphohydrolase n=1 Tax=Nocardia sp. NPDC052566 TaxID=3364330 RepID=UPI0037C84546
MSTQARLLDSWVALAGDTAREVGAELIDRYREPHRRYHTVDHLATMLHVIDELAADADDVDAVRYAAFFHDAVYAIDRPDNEERSAELAESVLESLGAPAELVDEVVRLVRLTATHHAAPGDRNGSVLCDADLAILAAAEPEYVAYTEAIRQEYHQVPDEAFRLGRAAVLRSLADQPNLFRTGIARTRFEAPARANLAAELAKLTS